MCVLHVKQVRPSKRLVKRIRARGFIVHGGSMMEVSWYVEEGDVVEMCRRHDPHSISQGSDGTWCFIGGTCQVVLNSVCGMFGYAVLSSSSPRELSGKFVGLCLQARADVFRQELTKSYSGFLSTVKKKKGLF